MHTNNLIILRSRPSHRNSCVLREAVQRSLGRLAPAPHGDVREPRPQEGKHLDRPQPCRLRRAQLCARRTLREGLEQENQEMPGVTASIVFEQENQGYQFDTFDTRLIPFVFVGRVGHDTLFFVGLIP